MGKNFSGWASSNDFILCAATQCISDDSSDCLYKLPSPEQINVNKIKEYPPDKFCVMQNGEKSIVEYEPV